MNFLLTIGSEDFTQSIIETKGFLETLGFGAQMLLLGLATVFAVLLLIWGALALFELFFHRLPNKNKSNDDNGSNEANNVPVYVSDESEDEVIAVIAAAIAMAESETSGVKFKVVSFKRK